MHTKKQLKILIPLIAIGTVLFMGYEGFGWKADVENLLSSLSTGGLLDKPQENAQSQAVIDESWQVLEEYITAVKIHDYDSVKRLSHKLSETCLDESKREECYVLMDSVYYILSQLKKDMFIHTMSNGTKITLFTDNLDGARIGLYFVRDAEGEPRVAGMKICQVTDTALTPDECSALQ